jgi:hypothetical protein
MAPASTDSTPSNLDDLAQRLRVHVERLAGLIGPRHPGRPSALEAAAAYVRRELGQWDEAVTAEPYQIGGQSVANYYMQRPGVRKPQENPSPRGRPATPARNQNSYQYLSFLLPRCDEVLQEACT